MKPPGRRCMFCRSFPRAASRVRQFLEASPLRLLLPALLLSVVRGQADWPTLHGNSAHDGFVDAGLRPPFRLAWARHFAGDRLGTAMEPIVSHGLVFIATHRGNLHALDALTGVPRWTFTAQGPFLHSPASTPHAVLGASTDGFVYALDPLTGAPLWTRYAGHGGFAASPVTDDARVLIGTRTGTFLALDLRTGALLWSAHLGAPIRQSAATSQGRVVVTTEDLRVWSFRAADGRREWTSEPLAGQSARDYYPVLVVADGRPWVVVRTNPTRAMAQRISEDRHLLATHAGLDDSRWEKLDDWTRSDQATGDADLWRREQEAITHYLTRHPDAGTFFILDAVSGRLAPPPPILWAAGCQGVGAPPSRTADHRLLVLCRTAYGHWSRGVAPLVGLGLLGLDTRSVEPLAQTQGNQPPWNTFWGTADETQNFVVAGATAFIIHQGTLSQYDLRTRLLSPVWGERDTFGGFTATPSALNEWHGPARGSVAIVPPRLYWFTGSRLLCLTAGMDGPAASDDPLDVSPNPRLRPLAQPTLFRGEIPTRLDALTREFLSQRWAPLCVEPGLAGREFFFDNSGDAFESLAWAFPHLPPERQSEVRDWLALEWTQHPPYTAANRYPLDQGARRELWSVPPESLVRLGHDTPPHPFGNLQAAKLYADRCGEWERVLGAWPAIAGAFEEFRRQHLQTETAQGRLHANRYLASLLAFETIALRAGDTNSAQQARDLVGQLTPRLVARWQEAAAHPAADGFKGSAELDRFIGSGSALSVALAPHRHKIALFRDLTPQTARLLDEQCPDAVRSVWQQFERLHPTWFLVGEERQVHCGENYLDPPDFARDAFKASLWLGGQEEAADRHVDLPMGRADLNHLLKLALYLEQHPPPTPRDFSQPAH